MATTRLSDAMITAMLDALTRPTTDDRYRVFTTPRTATALVTRGKAERIHVGQEGRTYLTAEGITYLRNALEYVLNQRGEERDTVWRLWLDADYRNRDAVTAFLVTDADTYEIATTTPHERGTHRETVTRDDARERMNNAIRNGQRITLHDGALTVHTKLGARWTFTAQGFAVEVEHTSYERHTGAQGRGWARRTGIDNPASVRFMIHRANRRGDAVTVEDGGVIRVDNAGRVDPNNDGAGEPCPIWFVPVRRTEEDGKGTAAADPNIVRAELLMGKLPTAEQYTHRVMVSGRSDDATLSRGVTVETIAAELRQGASVSWATDSDGLRLRLHRHGYLTHITAAAAEEAPAPRMVATCCSCGAGIEMPMDGPRPACTHEGETRPNGGIVLGGRVVRRAERGTCYTDRHIIRDVERWESGNTMARCAECVALDLGVSVDALPGYKPEPRPAAEVLAADPIPADTSVRDGMPGLPVGRGGLVEALTDEAYVIQVRSERVWQLPNHDDGAHMTRSQVMGAVGRVRQGSPERARVAVDNDGTLYLSNGYQAARYIPVRLIAGYSADSCPGCGTPYATNGDGPCEGGRSPLAPGSRDYDAEAAALLGDGAEWVRHGYSDSKLTSVNGMNRREALAVVVAGLKRGEVRPADDGRGVRVVFPAAKSAYWLEPVTVQPNPEEAEERPQGDQEEAANLGARFLPQDPADEDTRPCVELPTGEQVYVYRKGGRLVVSVDLDTATEVRDDGTVPMVITVQGNTVFEG